MTKGLVKTLHYVCQYKTCEAQRRLIVVNKDNKDVELKWYVILLFTIFISIYRNSLDHDTECNNLMEAEESKEQKDTKLKTTMALHTPQVQLLINHKVKPANIVKEIQKQVGGDIDNSKQIQNAINYKKRKEDYDIVIENVNDFQDYVGSLPSPRLGDENNFDDHQILNLASYFDPETEEPCFYVSLSTKSLLQNYVKQRSSHEPFMMVDGTYKLNKNMLPLLVAGTYSKGKRFYLLALCISTNETKRAYEFFLEYVLFLNISNNFVDLFKNQSIAFSIFLLFLPFLCVTGQRL